MSRARKWFTHYLDPATSWALCGSLPEGRSWSPDLDEVSCPACLLRLVERAERRRAGESLDGAEPGSDGRR